jgi:hypothetical protein
MRGAETRRWAATVLLAAAALAGCSIRSDLMDPAGRDAASVRPDPDKALVVFMRRGREAGAIQAVVYDGDKLVGVLSANTVVAYQTEPGKHLFMVVSEAADFLEATLLPGKTYYVRVVPRMGWWRARFSLEPVDARRHARDIPAWLRALRLVALNDAGRRWAVENDPSVIAKKNEYLPRWRAKPEDKRPALRPGDGV